MSKIGFRAFFLVFFIMAWGEFASVHAVNPDFEDEFGIERMNTIVQAPDFTAEDIKGRPHRLSDYRNGIVLLNFWATWCLPCVRELPHFHELQQAMSGKDFVILAVNVQDRLDRVSKFLKGKPYQLIIVRDKDGDIYRQYGVRGFPATFIIDAQGRHYGKISGVRNWSGSEVVEYFKMLLKSDSNDYKP